ncbi:hypothetical protein [Arthrobacter sp. NPDC056727]|uniref:hypothetical protein n=1 Tax=Arthrobacter sp. NPDC056727 TaxID=3345927 RepID=UPI00366CC086
MGIGDSIGKAAENAMEDLAQTSDPTDDAHVPEPGAEDDDIQVHSSISEGSNARDGDDGPQQSAHTAHTPQSQGTEASGSHGTSSTDESAGAAASGGIGATGATDAPEAARGVPGPAGLPDPDPEELRADPSEGDRDPGTGLGRG